MLTLVAAVRDRDVIETESSIKVFEKAWGWVKIVGTIATVMLTLLGAGIFWKASDWSSGVEAAKQSVISTSNSARIQIENSVDNSGKEIFQTAQQAKETLNTASIEAAKQSDQLKQVARQTRNQMSQEARAFRTDVENSRVQLQAASKLQPEMLAIRQQMNQATNDIKAQQKIISSSEEFVKGVLSSHSVEFFKVGLPSDTKTAVFPPPPNGDRTVVFLVLQTAPLKTTLQLQFHIYSQPQNSYFTIHNLVIFFWGQAPEAVKAQQLSASYFPDPSDKDLIHSLSQHDGRVFADDEPMPKYNQPDPDFRGNKWIPVQKN